MRRLSRWIALGVLSLAVAAPVAAQATHKVLVFRDGRAMHVKGWEQRGDLTYITGLNDQVNVVKTETVDFERSRRATASVRTAQRGRP